MNYRLFILFFILLFLVSCSNEGENEENIVIAGKNLSSITHVFYNYVYADLPPTRTFTTNYILNDNKIDFVNSSVFHYFDEEPSRNYTAYDESTFSYNNSRLIKVERESYSDYDLTEKYFLTYEFDYYENGKIKELALKGLSGALQSKYFFVYQNNTIERKYEYYEDNNLIFYNETLYQIDTKQRIYHQTSKGPIFESTDPNSLSETTQEASFDVDGNVYRTLFDGSPSEEYEYTTIKIPSDVPNINLPFFGYIPYDILLAQFDGIIQSYNTNYVKTIVSLNPTSALIKSFKYKLSKDHYPLKKEVFMNDKIRSKTMYTYE